MVLVSEKACEEWTKIIANYCEKLVKESPKGLTEVKQFKDNSTKYWENASKLLILETLLNKSLTYYLIIEAFSK